MDSSLLDCSSRTASEIFIGFIGEFSAREFSKDCSMRMSDSGNRAADGPGRELSGPLFRRPKTSFLLNNDLLFIID